MAAAAALCVSCNEPIPDTPVGPTGGEGDGELTVTVESSTIAADGSALIQANGEDTAEVKVTYQGKAVEIGDKDLTIFNADDDKPLAWTSLSYKTTEATTLKFWVAYKTVNTRNTPCAITSVKAAIPDAATDPQPDKTSFKHRVMLTQFTGLGCMFCPYMIVALESLFEDKDYTDKAVLTVSHSYQGDPFDHKENLDGAMGIAGYPTVVADMHSKISNYGIEPNIKNLKALIDKRLESPVQAGISAVAASGDNAVVVRATVKAAAKNTFRIGAWLLEDGLTGEQYNPDKVPGDFNTHNDVIRLIDSRVSSNNYTGHDLGTLAAGETAECTFLLPLDKSWKKENCHIVLFVSTPEGKRYFVNNAISVPSLDATVAFDYE